MDIILEGIKELEARGTSVESRVDKRETSHSNRRSRAKSNSEEPMYRFHKSKDKAKYCRPTYSFKDKQEKSRQSAAGGDAVSSQ